MKMSQDGAPGTYRILGYREGSVQINDAHYTESLLLMPDRLIPNWGPSGLSVLDHSHLEAIRALDPEVVLLGTGKQQQFPEREYLLALIQAGVGVEVMDTASACRTYNVLMSEGRRVVAALIIEPADSLSD